MEKVTQLSENGEGGIRTHDALADMLVFKTRAINHSTTSPRGSCPGARLINDSNPSHSLDTGLSAVSASACWSKAPPCASCGFA